MYIWYHNHAFLWYRVAKQQAQCFRADSLIWQYLPVQWNTLSHHALKFFTCTNFRKSYIKKYIYCRFSVFLQKLAKEVCPRKQRFFQFSNFLVLNLHQLMPFSAFSFHKYCYFPTEYCICSCTFWIHNKCNLVREAFQT